MAYAFDPATEQLIGQGHAARTLLLTMNSFCGLLLEESLKKLDARVANDALDAETALALCHELAAYRRIVLRMKQHVTMGERAATHKESA